MAAFQMSFLTIGLLMLAFGHFGWSHPIEKREEPVFALRIVHTNDMHARFEETSALSAKCSPKDAAAKKCYGGFARIATLVRQARNSSVPTLFLNAGDTYQGTVWYGIHKWRIVTRFLNLLAPDAVSLGNHEFDDGVEGLIPYINGAEFPVVTANLDLTKEPALAASKLKNSTILEVAGQKIGVIGYLTPDTKVIAATGKVEFIEEVKAVRREAELLKAAGVKILIAVGHSGFAMDKKIAAEVEGLDLVIGGHTNTFLYTGKTPDREVPEGLYPTEVVQKDGRKVYVVQAYAYTKYLGNITVDFDKDGEVTKIFGNPILVDGSIEQAKDILDELEKFRPEIDAVSKNEIGTTKVLLDGDSKSCRRHECNLGNLISDAMVDYNAREYGKAEGWTDAAIALHNGGTIRNSIKKGPGEKITMGDVLGVLPFNNALQKITINGSKLLEVMEWGVKTLDLNVTSDLNGAYLQFSGVQVVYDLNKPHGSRVHSVSVRCANCSVPSYSDLDLKQNYTVLVTDFMTGGGDGYTMLLGMESTAVGVTTDQVLSEYIKAKSPVHPGVEWRIDYLPLKTEPSEPVHIDTKPSKPNSSPSTYKPAVLAMALPLLAMR